MVPPPDITSPEPPATPEAPPAEVPLPSATANENPVLPHDARAASARTSAILSQAIDLASSPDPDLLAETLARVLAMMQAALADVDRFVPEAFRDTAADQANQMISGL